MTAATTLATRILRLQQRAVAIEVRGFTLEVIAGPDTGKLHKAKQRSVLIGTHPSADVVLSDPHVSRLHARLDVEDDEYVLRDLGSTNGTRVSEVKIREACLAEGALVEVGTSRLRFRFSGEPFEIPLADEEGFEGLIGRSVAMRELFQMCARVAPSEATVLIEGETGSGKELVAEALHRRSRRKDRPFVVFDCGAVPATLIESELFGHERGAFTGAVAARAGVFERADGGTLFLDELGELAVDLQPKLLRALESGEIQRVGGEKVKKVDVRVIAATHRDLEEVVRSGAFRQDLFFRLAHLPIDVPSLAERREDVKPLFVHFVDRFAAANRVRRRSIEEAVFRHLESYSWPGNVRELRNLAERLVVFGAEPITVDQLPSAFFQPTPAPETGLLRPVEARPVLPLREFRAECEREYIESVLRRTDWNFAAAARLLEIQRTYLHQKVAALGIERPARGLAALDRVR